MSQTWPFMQLLLSVHWTHWPEAVSQYRLRRFAAQALSLVQGPPPSSPAEASAFGAASGAVLLGPSLSAAPSATDAASLAAGLLSEAPPPSGAVKLTGVDLPQAVKARAERRATSRRNMGGTLHAPFGSAHPSRSPSRALSDIKEG
jgi:hypothetical protein